MSPASQGGLEVERYIGSCLISANVRQNVHKPIIGKKQETIVRGKARGCYGGQCYGNGVGNEQCQVQYGPGGWTGAPLISMTSPRRCNQRSSPSLLQQQQQQQQSQSQQQQQLQHQQQQQQQSSVCDQHQTPGQPHKSPLSRLAVHTQGAPLILTGRFHNRGKAQHAGNGLAGGTACNGANGGGYVHTNGNTNAAMNGASRCPPPRAAKSVEAAKKPQQQPQLASKADCAASSKENNGTNIANIDSLSIASDESSGSNNSENSLPRIIKPRKRRKKDRKPPNNVTSSADPTKLDDQQQQQSLNSTNQQEQICMAIPKAYGSTCYDQQRYDVAIPPHLRNHRRPPVGREAVYGCRAQSSMQELADVRQRYAHRHAQVKVLDDNRNVVVPVRAIQHQKNYRHNNHHHHHHHIINNNNNNNNSLNTRYVHEYEQTISCEDGMRDGMGVCQCRYCDPSALIWDGYSPFLASPPPSNDFCPGHYPQIPVYLSRPSLGCQEQQQAVERLFDVENPRLRQDRESGVVLRRSWSDPTSYFSEEITAPSKDVGVIGDRGGQLESGKRRTLWRGDTLDAPANMVGAPASPKGLEVSTEIVTSPNGHRDLEIKFYSSPSVPASAEEDKSVFAEEVDEEKEDFSDIWSYHESKLQQDFRTLLQAEE